MILRFTTNFQKQYQKLPLELQKKVDKQLRFLQVDFRHPSLKASKKGGTDEFEARVDNHNRFSYLLEGEIIVLLSVGSHDVGLGKK